MRSRSWFRKRRVGLPSAIAVELSAISHRKRFASASARFYCTDIMKRLLLKNWRAKLISLLLATTPWYLIKKNVATTPSPSETTSPPSAGQRRYLLQRRAWSEITQKSRNILLFP